MSDQVSKIGICRFIEKARAWIKICLILVVCFQPLILSTPVLADDANPYPSSDHLTGDWSGLRASLKDKGIDITGNYTSEPMGNVSGGMDQGVTYADNIGLAADFDLQRLVGLPNTVFRVKIAQRNGRSLTDEYIGNEFTVQELFGGQNFHLINVQGISTLFDDRLELGYGRIAYNDVFTHSPLYCTFLNNAFCGTPVSVFKNMPNGVSAYPNATWGVRATGKLTENIHLQAGIYDGDPVQSAYGTDWSFGDNGVLIAGEAHYLHNRYEGAAGLPGTYKVGFYHHTGKFDIFDQDIAGGNPLVSGLSNKMKSGSTGFNLQIDQMVYRESSGSSQGLWVFGNVLFGVDESTQLLPAFFITGLVYEGLFPSRPKDQTAFGITTGWYSDNLRRAQREAGVEPQNAETVLEFNHRFNLDHGISFQPDLQYIIHPKGTDELDNALVVGFRLSADF